MNDTSGLVIKITEQFVVVMCDDGKFRNLSLPKEIPAVGERITVPLRRKKRMSPVWFSAAAACLLIFLGFTFWSQMQPEYDQVVAIDINPSLELYLDAEQRLIKAKALNPDAEKVLSHFPSGKITLQDAVRQVVTNSIALGYINKDKENIIMISAARFSGGSEINASAIESVVTKTLQSEHLNGFVKVERTDKSLYDQAKEKNVSLNKWLLIQRIEQLGIHLNFDKAVSESAEQVLQEAGIGMERFFSPIQSTKVTGDQKIEPLSKQNNNTPKIDQSTMNPAGSSSGNLSGSTLSPYPAATNDRQQNQTVQTPAGQMNNNTIPGNSSGPAKTDGSSGKIQTAVTPGSFGETATPEPSGTLETSKPPGTPDTFGTPDSAKPGPSETPRSSGQTTTAGTSGTPETSKSNEASGSSSTPGAAQPAPSDAAKPAPSDTAQPALSDTAKPAVSDTSGSTGTPVSPGTSGSSTSGGERTQPSPSQPTGGAAGQPSPSFQPPAGAGTQQPTNSSSPSQSNQPRR